MKTQSVWTVHISAWDKTASRANKRGPLKSSLYKVFNPGQSSPAIRQESFNDWMHGSGEPVGHLLCVFSSCDDEWGWSASQKSAMGSCRMCFLRKTHYLIQLEPTHLTAWFTHTVQYTKQANMNNISHILAGELYLSCTKLVWNNQLWLVSCVVTKQSGMNAGFHIAWQHRSMRSHDSNVNWCYHTAVMLKHTVDMNINCTESTITHTKKFYDISCLEKCYYYYYYYSVIQQQHVHMQQRRIGAWLTEIQRQLVGERSFTLSHMTSQAATSPSEPIRRSAAWPWCQPGSGRSPWSFLLYTHLHCGLWTKSDRQGSQIFFPIHEQTEKQ